MLRKVSLYQCGKAGLNPGQSWEPGVLSQSPQGLGSSAAAFPGALAGSPAGRGAGVSSMEDTAIVKTIVKILSYLRERGRD